VIVPLPAVVAIARKMKYRLFILLYVFAAASGEAQTKSKGKTKAEAPPPADEPPPAMAVPKIYRYEPRGRRDPFVNPVPKPVVTEAAPEIPVVRPPGLPGVLLNEAVVAGVVTSKEPSMNVAIIKAPGGRTYFAYRGDALFDAVVKEIRPDGVIFTLSTPGRPSTTPPREIERKVRPSPGEK
jgi:hypothetical protein